MKKLIAALSLLFVLSLTACGNSDAALRQENEALRQQTARCIRQHRHHWRREVAEKGAEGPLAALVADRLAALRLAELRADGLYPLPTIGRFALRATAETAPAEDSLF